MIFKDLHKMLLNVNKESLDKSIADCHIKGCFSLVVGGTEHGNLTRVFIATKKIKPFDIQFHSHRYDLKIGVIHGVFEHHIAYPLNRDAVNPNFVTLKEYDYKSPLNGGNGLVFTGVNKFCVESAKIPIGGELYLDSKDIHSVSVSKGSIWVVQELGFQDDSSVVLGTDFSTEGLYNKPEQFQVNNMYEQVLKHLKKLV
jgi:hypothetical protein